MTSNASNNKKVDDLSAVWKALANQTRREILDVLYAGPASTGELAKHCGELSRFAVMQHLQVLVEADLVISRKEGRVRVNHLNPVPIQQISDRWISRYQRPLTEALIDLKFSLESEAQASPAKRVEAKDTPETGASA